MRFKVYLLRRGGRRLDWRDVVNQPPHFGELLTHLVSNRGRQYSAATLRPVDAAAGTPAGGPSVPDLYEPVLVGVSSLAFRLRGYERLEDRAGVRAVLQEWHCELP
jgi:hypothetical protein